MRRMATRLRKYAEAQKHEHMLCPRCGENAMNENVYRNALSRHASIYICSDCGTAEALNDFLGVGNDFNEWYAMGART